jgi:Spy/CpxP family protein refolding chaperone
MKLFKDKLTALTAVAALTAVGLFAQATETPRHNQRQGRSFGVMATALNLTDDQKAQAKSIFGAARESAKPIRQQLRDTRKSLHAAVQSGNAEQIQQLSVTQGTQMGQLTAIRSAAFAKFYQTLTPEQQQKAQTMRQKMHGRRRAG